MSLRRRLLWIGAAVAVVFVATRVGLWLLPSEERRLVEAMEGLAERLLAGDFAAVLEHVDLERYPLRAEAMGEVRTFGPEDAQRLLERAEDAAGWFPLDRASLTVVDAEVGGQGDDDDAQVAVRLSFEDEGQRYADTFDLSLRRDGQRWLLVGVRLRPSPGAIRAFGR